MTTAFASLPLLPEFLENLNSMDYLEMTPIQALSLQAIIDGKDVKAQAKTGSGKTAAFGIGLLHKLQAQEYHTQGLILCPTRELADQVSKELRRLARPLPNIKILTLCGGKPMGPQLASLEHPPHIVVGTPGRILKHCEKGTLKLDRVSTLVLDEADRMLDMGFLDDIQSIISNIPSSRQTLLFSATYPPEIQNISAAVQRDPIELKVESVHNASVIEQIFYEVPEGSKTKALVALLQKFQPVSSVVFCNRKAQCQELADELKRLGFEALALHGDMEQKDRDKVLVQFSNHSIPLLIATDVAARGLDIKELSAVINYELSPDADVYIHRIGRTGRAGNEGLALNLFHRSEAPKVSAIERAISQTLRFDDIPTNDNAKAVTLKAAMVTLCINSGRKNKIRAGDILGALTGSKELSGEHIGKIDIFDMISYVAIAKNEVRTALNILQDGKIKGKKVQVRKL